MAREINRIDPKDIEASGFWHSMPKNAETVEAETKFDCYNRKQYFGVTGKNRQRELFEDWDRKQYVFD